MNNFFRVKRLDSILAEERDSKDKLKRVLGAFDVVMLGIGAIIGAAAGIVLLVVSVVMGAIEWGLASFVMPFVAKFMKQKFWNMVISYSIIGAIISLISGSLGLMALIVSVITAAIFTWITMKFVKIKE